MTDDRTSAPKADALPGCATPRLAEPPRFTGDSTQAESGLGDPSRQNAARTGEGSPGIVPNLEEEAFTPAEHLEAWRFNVALECSGASLCAIESIAVGGAVLTMASLLEALEWATAEIDGLRASLTAIRDGDFPRPVGRSWFPDGRASKHDRCIHDNWMYEDCEACIGLFIDAALAPVGQSRLPLSQGEG